MSAEQKKLLFKAIIAFDMILQDALDRVENKREMHEVTDDILQALVAQLDRNPKVTLEQFEYVMNMADIGSRLRLMAICLPPNEASLAVAIKQQREKLGQLGNRNVVDLTAEEGDEERVIH